MVAILIDAAAANVGCSAHDYFRVLGMYSGKGQSIMVGSKSSNVWSVCGQCVFTREGLGGIVSNLFDDVISGTVARTAERWASMIEI